MAEKTTQNEREIASIDFSFLLLLASRTEGKRTSLSFDIGEWTEHMQ